MYVQHNTLVRWRYHNRRGNATIHFMLLTLSRPNGTILRRVKEILNKKLGGLIFYTNFALNSSHSENNWQS
jgi:hypothetical protein